MPLASEGATGRGSTLRSTRSRGAVEGLSLLEGHLHYPPALLQALPGLGAGVGTHTPAHAQAGRAMGMRSSSLRGESRSRPTRSRPCQGSSARRRGRSWPAPSTRGSGSRQFLPLQRVPRAHSLGLHPGSQLPGPAHHMRVTLTVAPLRTRVRSASVRRTSVPSWRTVVLAALPAMVMLALGFTPSGISRRSSARLRWP